MTKTINVKGVKFGGNNPLALIAGPCVIESREGCMAIADKLVKLAKRQNIPLVFKASYDKETAHRSTRTAARALKRGWRFLRRSRRSITCPF